MGWHSSTTLLVTLVPLTVVTVDIVWQILQSRIERKGYPLPPGPTQLPFLGNVLSINAKLPWLTYTEWQATYGDIIYVRLLDTDVIVLNSVSAAVELLEKRSRIYSDRPFIPSVVPYGHDCNFGLERYGEHWRLCRRIFQQTFQANSAFSFRPMQIRRARQLVCNMVDAPEEYSLHFHTFSSAISMSAVYDYEPSPRNDPMVSIVNKYLEASVMGLSPGKTLLLKFFPFLLHIPVWLPGSWIRREANEAYAWRNRMIETPYQYVQKRMESKDHMNAAMVSDHITRMERFSGAYRSKYETALKHASATAFLGSTGTTSSVLMTFMLAMVKNPHVWKRAQVMIDAVVGTERLPEFDDRPSLPYIDAIVRETLRWRPVAPIGVPHAVTCSDIFEGYYIPKGATVLVNAWAMSRDGDRYLDAENFIPERFLDSQGRLRDDDPGEFIFGFGRRRCAGVYVADASLWSAIATMLATLDFNLAKDADGNNITFEATFTSGITDCPNPFPCRITPRQHVTKELLARILAE